MINLSTSSVLILICFRLEMDDLTTTLFEEAHEMVAVEKAKRAAADKRYAEAKNKVDVSGACLRLSLSVSHHLSVSLPSSLCHSHCLSISIRIDLSFYLFLCTFILGLLPWSNKRNSRWMAT